MNDAALGQELKDDADPLPQRVSRAKWVIAKAKGVRRDSELKSGILRNDPHYFSPVLFVAPKRPKQPGIGFGGKRLTGAGGLRNHGEHAANTTSNFPLICRTSVKQDSTLLLFHNQTQMPG